ncbi:MAG TPA: PAS domain-containing protein, partial [Chryseolinea sp.]|nr:PAS domain-containing protein [Chryseolinea sp.]
ESMTSRVWKYFSTLLTPPVFLNEEKLRKAKLLIKVVRAVILTALVGFVSSLFEPENKIIVTAFFYGLVFIALIGFIYLIRKGKVMTAGWLLSLFIWCIVAFATLFFGGLKGQIAAVFGVVIMFVGSFQSGRAAVGVAIGSITFLAGVAFLEVENIMPTQLGPSYSPINAWTGLCITFLLMSVLLHNSLTSIKESEERYQLAVRGSGSGLWDWNILTGKIYYAPGFKKMLGYEGTEFPEWVFSPDQDIHPDDLPKVRETIDAHLSSSAAIYDIEYRMRLKSGEYRWFHAKGEALRNKQGKPYRMVGSIVDISKRKLAEESIALQHTELQKINIELDRFVYSASHDLRAPISSLLGLIEVARLEREPSKIEGLLDMQKRSLLKLDNFISDIVSYSRNNRLQLEVEEINFQVLLEDIFDQLHFMAQLSQLRVSIQVDKNLSFYGDKKRISIVLNNLITNAIKYSDTSKQDPFIQVLVEKLEKGVGVKVIDNGEGIEDKETQKIFDMFYRASQRSTGSGIGLYIVKEVVQKLRGTIQVHSKRFEGTEFILYFQDLRKEQSAINDEDS